LLPASGNDMNTVRSKETYKSKVGVSKKAGTEKDKSNHALCPITFDAEATELMYISEYNKQQLGKINFHLVAPFAFVTLYPFFRIE